MIVDLFARGPSRGPSRGPGIVVRKSERFGGPLATTAFSAGYEWSEKVVHKSLFPDFGTTREKAVVPWSPYREDRVTDHGHPRGVVRHRGQLA
jgi:hypothetical protein